MRKHYKCSLSKKKSWDKTPNTCWYLILFFFTGVLISCEVDVELEDDIILTEDLSEYCPTCNDTLFWNAYGKWRFGQTGYDGAFGKGIPVHLERTCDYKIYQGHAGGIGNTYQVYHEECGNGVILIWKYERLSAVSLIEGWTGCTKEGIKLGDNMEHFQAAYPDFVVADHDSLTYHLLEPKFYINLQNDTVYYNVIRAKATFNEDQELIHLYAD